MKKLILLWLFNQIASISFGGGTFSGLSTPTIAPDLYRDFNEFLKQNRDATTRLLPSVDKDLFPGHSRSQSELDAALIDTHCRLLGMFTHEDYKNIFEQRKLRNPKEAEMCLCSYIDILMIFESILTVKVQDLISACEDPRLYYDTVVELYRRENLDNYCTAFLLITNRLFELLQAEHLYTKRNCGVMNVARVINARGLTRELLSQNLIYYFHTSEGILVPHCEINNCPVLKRRESAFLLSPERYALIFQGPEIKTTPGFYVRRIANEGERYNYHVHYYCGSEGPNAFKTDPTASCEIEIVGQDVILSAFPENKRRELEENGSTFLQLPDTLLEWLYFDHALLDRLLATRPLEALGMPAAADRSSSFFSSASTVPLLLPATPVAEGIVPSSASSSDIVAASEASLAPEEVVFLEKEKRATITSIEAIKMEQIRKEQEEVARWVIEGAKRTSGGGGSSSGTQRRKGKHRRGHSHAAPEQTPEEVTTGPKVSREMLRKLRRELDTVLAKKSSDYRDVIDFTNNILKHYRGMDPIRIIRQGSHVHFHREGVGSALLVRKHGRDGVYKPSELETFGSTLINMMLGMPPKR